VRSASAASPVERASLLEAEAAMVRFVAPPARSTAIAGFVAGGRIGVVLGTDAVGRGLLAGAGVAFAGGGGGDDSAGAGGGEGAGAGDVVVDPWLAASGDAGVSRAPGAGSGCGVPDDDGGLNGSGLGCPVAGAAVSTPTAATIASVEKTRTLEIACIDSGGSHRPPFRRRAR
jgi:hypothetical protein